MGGHLASNRVKLQLVHRVPSPTQAYMSSLACTHEFRAEKRWAVNMSANVLISSQLHAGFVFTEKLKIHFPFLQILIHGLPCNLFVTLIVSFQKEFSIISLDFHILFYTS